MHYRANGSDPGIGSSWTLEAFDDSNWPTGSFGTGYETATGAQQLIQTPVPAGTRSIYTRSTFQIGNVASVVNLRIGADYDDGWVAWINGVEVYRSPQMPPGVPAWNTSPAMHESSNASNPSYVPIVDISTLGIPALHNGTNVIAVGVWNVNATSSDLVLVPRLLRDEPPTTIRRGPYLQLLTPDSVVVRWRTADPTNSRVAFGTDPESLNGSVEQLSSGTEHELAVDGLVPNTTYYYAIGDTTLLYVGGDEEHSFRTPSVPGTRQPTRIWVLGDSGTGSSGAMAVRDSYRTFTGDTPTDVWLMLGDNAYPNGTDSQYQSGAFDMYSDLFKKTALWPTYGNHDAFSASSTGPTGPTGVYYDIFTLPTAGQAGGLASATEAYYSFDYANIHFICMNSQDVDRSIGGVMLAWLELDLADTSQDWVVAFWHHPPYSKGNHDSDTDSRMREMRERVLPILESHGVDLVLTGHSHSYERSFLLDGHYGLSDTLTSAMILDGGDGRLGGDGAYEKASPGPAAHEGAVYVVAGSSGQVTTGTPLNHPAIHLSLDELGSLVLDVRGDRMDAVFLDDNGAARDTFTLIKNTAELPTPDFSAEPSAGGAPLAVQFTDLSSTNTSSWGWSFDGDGPPDATAQHPSHSYNVPGLYAVRLDATNTAGTVSASKIALICVSGGPLTGTPQLVLPNRTAVSWSAMTAARYDVIRGSLGSLRSSGGDFGTTSPSCLVQATPDTTIEDPLEPGPSLGWYYLVRAVDCDDVAGTWDSGGAGQVGSRDSTLPAGVCP